MILCRLCNKMEERYKNFDYGQICWDKIYNTSKAKELRKCMREIDRRKRHEEKTH